MVDTTTTFLEHYGVPGMKWGRRRAVGSDGRITANSRRTKETPSEDHTTVKELRKKSTPALSNRDLKKINERLQLEKTYKELTTQTTVLDKGQKKVDKVLKTANTGVQFYNLYNSPAFKAAINLAKK